MQGEGYELNQEIVRLTGAMLDLDEAGKLSSFAENVLTSRIEQLEEKLRG
ncbi:MAG: hypothetical protein ACREIA_20555 [Opitutaceae bacterium]